MMITHLYRFRPIERLLGEEGELRTQTIFFAAPDKLNDPMEGFADTIWQGDRVVWENLLRHYLLCLDRACSLLAIAGEEHPVGWDMIPINRPDQLTTPQQQQRHAEIITGFLDEPVVQDYIDALASRTQPIRRNELAAHLRYLNLFAVSVIYDGFERHKLIAGPGLTPELIAKYRGGLGEASKVVKALKSLEAETSDGSDKIDAFYTSHRHTMEQLDFIHRYNGDIDIAQKNKNFVLLDFSDEYVRQIEKLVFPDWYTACFMLNCKDSSVWGHYGQKHTSACLKFKVSTTDKQKTINLTGMNGYGSGGPIVGKRSHPFYQLSYARKFPPVDFFRSLGRMPIPVLQQHWFTDRSGSRSACADALFKDQDAWRKRYWANFEQKVTTKLEDWQYEQEHRLILYGNLLDFSDEASRKLQYDFADLDGIIFGINTPSQAKHELCKIIEEKCSETRRTDFKFFQAFYSRSSGTIEHAELGLLKFKGGS